MGMMIFEQKHISVHSFRSARRRSAIVQKDNETKCLMKELDRVRGELQLWRQWWDSCRYKGEQRMIEGDFDQEAGPYEKMEGEQSLNEGESFEKETGNFVMESKIELEGEAAKVNENPPKKCKVKLQCEKFDQKSANTADELIVKSFGKESQLELKFEISRNESVTGTADVDAKKTVGRMPVIEQKSGKVDNKRMVLEWTPKKPSTKTRRV